MTNSAAKPSHANWDLPPGNRRALQHIDEVLKVAPVSRGTGPVLPLPSAPVDVSTLVVRCGDGAERTVDEILERTWTDGFLVLHRGRIVCERFFGTMTGTTRHFSQSVAKSISSTIAGILIGQGKLEASALLTDYVPALRDSGYAGASLSDVLNMRSGVRFTEDYNDPTSDVGLFDRASGWKPRDNASGPRTIREFILTTQAVRPHGEVFEYRSLEIELAAWVCEAVTGLKFPELTGRLLWSRIGAESDASFTVDSAGSAIADGGFSATLRDYGRFGLLFLNEGLVDGRPVVPRDWVMECRHGGTDHFRAAGHSLLTHYPRASYSNQWWVLDRDAGLITARGANGQLVYIDPARELVAVKLSSWPVFLDDAMELEALRAIETIGRHLT
jgi:CubicO group peptidase (beta-lactamase class C family)